MGAWTTRAAIDTVKADHIATLLGRKLHLIKKVGHTYKYYLTALGKQVIALGLKLKDLYIIPAISQAPSADCKVLPESARI
jgi:hypothetical protein